MNRKKAIKGELSMGNLKTKLTKIIARILIITMLTQSISMPVMAAEEPTKDREIVANISENEMIPEVEEKDQDPQESSNNSQALNELSGSELSENEIGGLNDVPGDYENNNIDWGQFYLMGSFRYYFANTGSSSKADIYMEQYNSQNQLISTYLLDTYANENGYCFVINNNPLCESTTKVRYKAIENNLQDTVYVSPIYERKLQSTKPLFHIGAINVRVESISIPWNVKDYAVCETGYKENLSVSITLYDKANNEITASDLSV